MRDALEYIIGSHGVIDDGNGFIVLRAQIAAVNRDPARAIESFRAWRAGAMPAEKFWSHRLAGLLYTPAAVSPLSDEVIDGLVSLEGAAEPLALRRLPAGLATVADAEIVLARLARSFSDLHLQMDLAQRIDACAGLAERVLAAFDHAMRPDTKVVYQTHALRPFAELARVPLASLLDAILRDVPQSKLDRRALFHRLWAWLRQGWLDEFRYVKAEDRPLRLAAVPETASDVENAIALLRAETQSVRESPSFRPLLFALLERIEDADGMRAALPPSPTWAHHEAIARVYEKRGQDSAAIAFLQSLKAGRDRDARLAELLRKTSRDEALAFERLHPSTLDVLAARYGKPRSELIEQGLERMRADDARDWLTLLVREANWQLALTAAKRTNPQDVLDMLENGLPEQLAYDLVRTALEHVFDARHVWSDAARAKATARELLDRTLALAPDEKTRAKTLKQIRTRTNKVLAKSSDFFTRDLAFTLDEALAKHEAP